MSLWQWTYYDPAVAKKEEDKLFQKQVVTETYQDEVICKNDSCRQKPRRSKLTPKHILKRSPCKLFKNINFQDEDFVIR